MCYLWVDAAKDRDNYKRYYEYYQEQAIEQRATNRRSTKVYFVYLFLEVLPMSIIIFVIVKRISENLPYFH